MNEYLSPHEDGVPGWLARLARLGHAPAVFAITASSVLGSVALTALLLWPFGIGADAWREALLLGAIVPAVVVPLASHWVLTMAARLQALRSASQRTVVRDELTGAYNRHYFEQRFETEGMRAVRARQALSLLLVDADNLQLLSERYGPDTGAQVLRGIARGCAASLRPYDVLARLGGERFVALLPATTLKQACDVAERVRLAVLDLKMQSPEGVPVPATVSVGVSSLTPEDTACGDLLERAAQALDSAKRDGRNRWAA
jgi:diguanylate cyclase (GGDEF)-like protein